MFLWISIKHTILHIADRTIFLSGRTQKYFQTPCFTFLVSIHVLKKESLKYLLHKQSLPHCFHLKNHILQRFEKIQFNEVFVVIIDSLPSARRRLYSLFLCLKITKMEYHFAFLTDILTVKAQVCSCTNSCSCS